MDVPTIQNLTNNFLKELQDADSGKKTSLPYIIHELPKTALVKNGELFQVIVVGGSMGKVATVRKIRDTIEVVSFEELNQPKFTTKTVLFEYLEKLIDATVTNIAIDFAFPLLPAFENGHLDGILVQESKEHTFKGLIGKQVGKAFEEYILNKRGQRIVVSMANDTICLLLSGLTKYPWDKIACAVLGTGFNGAFFIDTHHSVNLELGGNFNKFTRSDEAKLIDQQSEHPGIGIFEQEISGKYLYQHFNLIIQKQNIDFPPLASTFELKHLAFTHTPVVSDIAHSLLQKSAGYVAAVICAITLFKEHDIIFVMDGSFFWDRHYKEIVDSWIKQLKLPYKINFVQIENNLILGASQLII